MKIKNLQKVTVKKHGLHKHENKPNVIYRKAIYFVVRLYWYKKS